MTPGATAPPSKLGEQIALAIERRIAAQGLAIGDRLGTEIDLAASLGVSRWIMREGIAIAEMSGLVQSRRGLKGGLFVAEPGIHLAAATLRHYFMLAGASAQDINETRRVVEGHAVRMAAAAMTEHAGERLRAIVGTPLGSAPDPHSTKNFSYLHEILALTGSPVIRTLCYALTQANTDRAFWYGASAADLNDLSRRTAAERERQIEALIAGDADAVVGCEHRVIDVSLAMHRRNRTAPTTLATAMERASLLGSNYGFMSGIRKAKKPEALARLIAQRIADEGLQPGAIIGNEQDIQADFSVSRNVMREAKALLERYGIVRVQQGRGGGLQVMRSDPRKIVSALALLLAAKPGDDGAVVTAVRRDLDALAAALRAGTDPAGDQPWPAVECAILAVTRARPAPLAKPHNAARAP
jgi:DNA-binding FadR family transcriptional regulator